MLFFGSGVHCSDTQLVVVVIQFLSGVFPLAEMAGFTPLILQLLVLRLSTLPDSELPPSNRSSLSSPQVSSRFFSPPFVSSQGILFQTNLLCLFHLLPPNLLRSSSLSLATHFKIQSNSQNTIVVPPQHIFIPSNSIRCC